MKIRATMTIIVVASLMVMGAQPAVAIDEPAYVVIRKDEGCRTTACPGPVGGELRDAEGVHHEHSAATPGSERYVDVGVGLALAYMGKRHDDR